MSYAQSVLQPGEHVVATGHLHWIIYWPAMFFLVGAAVLMLLNPVNPTLHMLANVTAAAFGVLFVVIFVHAWFKKWITEFAVTNKRVIYKRGFIWRQTAEMNMDKVEAVDVTQSIPGRMLDYGTIHVKGTGAGIEHLHRIASPIALRNAIIAK
jgi:uncharacterized membrane protein YdbT with pleckstrin-like domain